MQQVNEKRADKRSADRRRSAPVKEREQNELESKLVNINRVTKVVKGGRILRFSSLVVVGDRNGRVAIGTGKAAEVPNAIEKATQNGKKNLIKVQLFKTTIPHEVVGKFGRTRVILLPAKEGTGITAGGSVRPVVELCGIKDITAKVYGSRNKINVVRATLNGLAQLKTKKQIAFLRGKTLEQM